MKKRMYLVAALSASWLCSVSLAAEIERVEPPFWWQGFKHQELQLQVYGDGIGAYVPTIEREGISISRVVRVKSPNYLFVYLDIDESAGTGDFDIVFRSGDDSLRHTYTLRQKNADPEHTDGFSNRDAIYLLMPDRFANGNTENDVIPALGDKLDRSDAYARHGGDLAGIADRLDYIRDMGFTQIWMNPVLENKVAEASYHGYSTTDFYRVDPRIGSNEQYRELVATARQQGIGIIMDMIANHIGDGHWWMDDLPTDDWLNYQGDPVLTTHARTTNQDRYASDYDTRNHANGWFVYSMPDLNQRNPLLADYLIQNAIWWTEYLGLSGIRMDTWPYPDKHFMSDWTRRIMDEYPNFNIVGEEWSTNPAIVSYWQRGKENPDGYVSYLPSLFDFPLQQAFIRALKGDVPDWQSPWEPVYASVANDFLYPDPYSLVIFADNHDMDRIYTQVGEDFDLYRMAMVFFSTMRGTPSFFYGDEILMSHPGTSSHGALRMDFPGGWPSDPKDAFEGEGLNRDQAAAQKLVRKLLNWRKTKDVVHDGRLMHFAPIDDVYAFFRYNDAETVMVVFNRGDEARDLDMARFAERTADATHASDVLTGKRFNIERQIVLQPRSVLLLELER